MNVDMICFVLIILYILFIILLIKYIYLLNVSYLQDVFIICWGPHDRLTILK